MADGYGMPSVDFSIVGKLPEDYQRGRIQAVRQQSLADLGRGADYRAVANRLLAAGDIEGGTSLARLGDAQLQRGFEERRLQIAEKQAEEKPTYQTIQDVGGNQQIIKLEPYGRGASRVNVEGLDTKPANPFMTNPKATEAQNKDMLYANRMFAAEKILRDPNVEKAATSAAERAKANPPIPLIGSENRQAIGNFLIGPDYQRFDQAKRDFVNATLRRESGAVINPSEFANAERQYFPLPGDSREVLEQKRRNRIEAIKGIAGGAGAGYRPPYTFDESGGIVEPNKPAAASSQPPHPQAKRGTDPNGNPAWFIPDPSRPGKFLRID